MRDCVCCACGGEIYPSDRVFCAEYELFHEDCLFDWASDHLILYECAEDSGLLPRWSGGTDGRHA